MNLRKKSLTLLTALSVVVGAGALQPAQAAKKKSGAPAVKVKATGDEALISSDPGAPTVREHRLLKWGPVDPPDRGKSPEFFVRGAFVDLLPMAQGDTRKDFYNMHILPVEVVENEYRVITFDSFANGMKIPVFLPKDLKKQFKPGGIVEVHLFYTTKEEQAIGHAKMIAFSYNEQILPYPVGPAAYIKKGGLDPEEYLNALKGMEIFGDNPKDEQLKVGLDALASSSPHAEVKNKATALLSSLFGAAPSGQALLPATPGTPAIPATENSPVKKKK